MEAKQLIEKLISYAKDKLYLSDADVNYKTRVLSALLKTESFDITRLPACTESLSELKKQLENYVCVSGISNDAEGFCALIFGILAPLPSETEKTFKLLREQFSSKKASEYYFGLMKDCGYIPEYSFEKLSDRKSLPQLTIKKGGASCGDHLTDARAITLDFEDGCLFTYDRAADFCEQGEFAVSGGKPFYPDEMSLGNMFEFVEYMPAYFVTASVCKDLDKYDKFYVGKDEFPLFDAKPTVWLKKEAFPDVDITITDWMIPHVRLSGYNKNTLISLVGELAEKWRGYRPEQLDLKAADKNFTNLSLRWQQDGKFVVDILFRTEKAGEERPLVSERLDSLIINEYPFTAPFGRFIFKESFSELYLRAVEVLTGKRKLDLVESADEGDEMYPVAELIADIFNKNGVVRDAVTAKTLLFDELYSLSKDYLCRRNVFTRKEVGQVGLKLFLLDAEIKQI